MEDTGRQKSDYSRVIETLIETFGEVVSEDVHAVVENCGGYVNESANAIMSLTLDSKTHISSSNTKHNSNIEQPPNLNIDGDNMKDIGEILEKKCHSQNINKYEVSDKQNRINKSSNLSTEADVQPSISYARASQGEAQPTQKCKQIMRAPNAGFNIWTNQLREILSHHNKGSRILIIMRGAPGSGKSFLAKQIIEMTVGATFFDYKKHILSTDDYFMVRGVYQFEKSKLSDAHICNQSRARAAMMRGLSPVIIDNTNIEVWEMEPYVKDAVRNGYLIEVVEPYTPWAKKANQLSRKNIHGVPFQSIKRMLDNFQNGVTGEYLRNYYRLCYPENMVPPVLRKFPPMPVEIPVEPTLGNSNNSPVTECNNEFITQESIPVQTQDAISNASSCIEPEELSQDNANQSDNSQVVENDNEENRNSLPIHYTYIEEQLEEYAKVENERENGENWEEETQKTQNNTKIDDLKKRNALWMESLMDQLDKVTKQTQLMVLQDEEFARQLALKEAELALAGKEPEVPDFKEIMDLDFTLSLYQKDVEEWRNNEPNDLAAKLTREKLYNLFPDISPNILSELLMAHDNNFQATVEHNQCYLIGDSLLFLFRCTVNFCKN